MDRQNPNVTKDCQPEAGLFQPEIDRSRCEAKSKCEQVCPYSVFMVRPLEPEEKKDFSFFGRIKLAMHGGQQAVAIASADCHACGLCVQVCPENAITLVAR
jgi:4Fe-4S ferredoxin